MKKLLGLFLAVFLIIIIPVLVLPPRVTAQGTLQCGSIVEGEFTKKTDSSTTINYYINLSPGDVLNVSGETVGNYLRIDLHIASPSGAWVSGGNYFQPPPVTTETLSERGKYTIQVTNQYGNAATGVFRLYIGCTLRDGTEIKPGDNAKPTSQASEKGQNSSVSVPAFGFPGLPPVDFSKIAQIPLQTGSPITGAITPTGGEILGYTFGGKTNATVDLNVSRLSGNLNLGLVVLAAGNKVVFQASLVTSKSLSTQLVLPSDGQYTVGIFRMDLLPPAKPEATAFQVQVQIK